MGQSFLLHILLHIQRRSSMKNIEEITIRPVTEADAEKLLSIYAPYVTDTFVTYEYTVPTVEEFRERIRNTLQASLPSCLRSAYSYSRKYKCQQMLLPLSQNQ